MREAAWDEIDRDGAVWTVPAGRMKNARKHQVPLSGRALEVLDDARQLADAHGWVFPSPTGRVLRHAALPGLLRELDTDAVPHGFRSSFRDWAAECTDAPREVCELALANVNTDRMEAVCRRTHLFDRRRVLMADWAAYGAVTFGDIAQLHRGLPTISPQSARTLPSGARSSRRDRRGPTADRWCGPGWWEGFDKGAAAAVASHCGRCRRRRPGL